MGKLKDGGKRIKYKDGGMKEPSDGRGRYDLIPTQFIRRLAKHYEKGAEKYSPWNWSKGIPYSKIIDSLKRHTDQWIEGDTSEDHLSAMAFWVAALIYFDENNMNDLDDRPVVK